jgi:hypothetical protein
VSTQTDIRKSPTANRAFSLHLVLVASVPFQNASGLSSSFPINWVRLGNPETVGLLSAYLEFLNEDTRNNQEHSDNGSPRKREDQAKNANGDQ